MKNDILNQKPNLNKGVGFHTFFSTSLVDYNLSIGEKYMQRKSYYKKENGTLLEEGTKTYCLVEESSEKYKLDLQSKWKKIPPDCDNYQGNKYALYVLVNGNGKSVGYYKVKKLKKISHGICEPEEIKYYKKLKKEM